VRARFLFDWHMHQLTQQSVLLQELAESHEQAVIGVRERPV
jgi:hypothetical protein